jgi:hypothetical protein
MGKTYFTTAKNGDTVEVDVELARQLIQSGKKAPGDFQIEETPDTVQSQATPETPDTRGAFRRAYDYAAGEPQENPSWGGMIWKGAGDQIVDRPIETLATGVASAFTPSTWAIPAQMLSSAMSSGIGNVADMIVSGRASEQPASESINEAVGTTIGSGLGSGLAWTVGKGLKAIGKPLVENLAKLAEEKLATQAFNKGMTKAISADARKELISNLVENIKPLSKLDDQSRMLIDNAQSIATQRLGGATKVLNSIELPNPGENSLVNLLGRDPEAYKSAIKAARKLMQEDPAFPEFRLGGPKSASPTDAQVAKYILDNNKMSPAYQGWGNLAVPFLKDGVRVPLITGSRLIPSVSDKLANIGTRPGVFVASTLGAEGKRYSSKE